MKTDRHPPRDLSCPIQFVKGIGPRRAEVLAEHGIRTANDLLHYYPFGYLDLSTVRSIRDLAAEIGSGRYSTVVGTIRSCGLVGKHPRRRFVMTLGDNTGTIQLVFFSMAQYFQRTFAPGEVLAASGKATRFGNRLQMVHPSIDRLSGEGDDQSGFLHTGQIVPKYGSSEDLKGVNLHVKGLRRIMRTIIDEFLPMVREHLPAPLLNVHRLIGERDALRWIHFPESEERLADARRRLKFDELFALQLMLAVRRASTRNDLPGIPFTAAGALDRRLIESLPFSLTAAQKRVLDEIRRDMAAPRPMNRLLQGDVGSGKTIVALTAMLIAVQNGWQAAFMAPTEILAEQHYRTMSGLLSGMPVTIRLLVGGQRSRLREDVLEDIRSGGASIVVGTHAIIQEHVKFAKLGLVVIDEQHRFGVSQRAALRQKGSQGEAAEPSPDMLVMTATPIPRTLSMTIYGDLDVSVIDELPASRKAIRTGLRGESQLPAVYDFVKSEIRTGRQAYVVYPLVEESEKLDLRSAMDGEEELKKGAFSDCRVGLIHGQMAADEKDGIMTAFKAGRIDLLVATTVIEVGIDVPNASVMIIRHAERFGLAQLHQLRGRVGRGAEQSYCILIAPDRTVSRVRGTTTRPEIDGDQEDAKRTERRLTTMLETTDGFKIAEIDLELRGPGDFFGTRQSGLPELQLANLITDGELLAEARTEAFAIIGRDPHLREPEHRTLREFLSEKIQGALEMMQTG